MASDLDGAREAFLAMLADAGPAYRAEYDGDETGGGFTYHIAAPGAAFEELAEALGIKPPGYMEGWPDAIQRALEEQPASPAFAKVESDGLCPHGQPATVNCPAVMPPAPVDSGVVDVREALTHARDTFNRYARLHRDKGTDEGDEKACANAAMGEEMGRALLALASSKEG